MQVNVAEGLKIITGRALGSNLEKGHPLILSKFLRGFSQALETNSKV